MKFRSRSKKKASETREQLCAPFYVDESWASKVGI